MSKVIVGIHGLANKPEKDVLEDWWRKSLDEGLEKNCSVVGARYDYVMVYWADLLYKHPVHFDKAMDFDRLYSEEPYRPAKSGALKSYEDGWLDAARAKAQALGGKALDVLKEKFEIDAFANWLLEKTLKDLAFYYDKKRRLRDRDKKIREARKVLMDELANSLVPLAGQEVMVIAHSMGSIIAYDVLRDLGRKQNPMAVAEFVTIGSPLGLPHVKGNIYEERKSYAGKEAVRTPTIVTGRWTNFADRRDPVAFDTHLRDDFKANKAGIRVRDDLVLNDYLGAKGRHNYHKSYGYLRTPELSKLVAGFLGR